jgi:hypothetical protein
LVPVSVPVRERPERVPLIVPDVEQAPVVLKVPEKLLPVWVKVPVPERDIELLLDEVYVNCQLPAILAAV